MYLHTVRSNLLLLKSVAILLFLALLSPGHVLAKESKKEPPVAKIKIAVMDLEPQNVKEALTTSLTNILRDTIFKTGKYEMLTREDMESILKNAAARAQLDPECDTDKCIADIAGALGVERMVAGSIGKVGGTYLISFRLVDTSKGKTINTHVERVKGSEEALIDGVVKGANILVIYVKNKQEQGKPVITHSPINTLPEGKALEVDAVVSDTGKVAAVKLFFRKAGAPEYEYVLMEGKGNSFFKTTIPEKEISGQGVEYFVEAVDSDGNIVRSTAPGSPHHVSVIEKKGKKNSRWKWILAIAGAGLLAGVVVALGGGGNTDPETATLNIEW